MQGRGDVQSTRVGDLGGCSWRNVGRPFVVLDKLGLRSLCFLNVRHGGAFGEWAIRWREERTVARNEMACCAFYPSRLKCFRAGSRPNECRFTQQSNMPHKRKHAGTALPGSGIGPIQKMVVIYSTMSPAFAGKSLANPLSRRPLAVLRALLLLGVCPLTKASARGVMIPAEHSRPPYLPPGNGRCRPGRHGSSTTRLVSARTANVLN